MVQLRQCQRLCQLLPRSPSKYSVRSWLWTEAGNKVTVPGNELVTYDVT